MSTQSESLPPILFPQIRSLPSKNGFIWLKAGWQLFKLAPGMAVLSSILMGFCSLLTAIVPVIGSVASTLLSPALVAGAFLIWQGLQQRGRIDLEDLFYGFKKHFEKLLLLGLLNIIAMTLAIVGGALLYIGILLGTASITGFELASFAEQAAQMKSLLDAPSMEILTSPLFTLILMGALLVMMLGVPVLMTQVFSPAFVVFYRMAPWDAMKASFHACLRNAWPYLAYSLGLAVLYLLGVLTLGLGLLIVVPIHVASNYYAMTDILGEIPIRAA